MLSTIDINKVTFFVRFCLLVRVQRTSSENFGEIWKMASVNVTNIHLCFSITIIFTCLFHKNWKENANKRSLGICRDEQAPEIVQSRGYCSSHEAVISPAVTRTTKKPSVRNSI